MKSATASRAVPQQAGSNPAATHRTALAGLALLVMIALGSPALAAGRSGLAQILMARPGGPAIGVDCPSCDPIDTLNTDNFSRPTRIEGPWMPLVPGTEWVFQGVRNIGGGLNPHTITFTVTNLVKFVGGLPCVVVWDRDVDQGDLRENELSFWAQDDYGNLWNIGEYPEEWEQGILIGAENTWVHGVEWAQAGVHIVKRPKLGTLGYREAIAPENDFWDCGMVLAKSRPHGTGDDGDDDDDKGHKGKGKDKGRGHDDRATLPPVCVPTGCYKDWVTIQEWAPLEGCDVIQLKTYAKGVGIVQIGALNDPEGETMVLASLRQLSPAELAEADRAALEADNRGYSINEIYATTPRAFVPPAKKHGDDDDDRALIASALVPPTPLHTFMRIGPNPVSTSASIAYSVTQAGTVELAIYDVAGRRVKSLVSGTTPAGTYRVDWDVRDDGGQAVGAGVYFARLRTPAQALGKTIVVTN